MGNQTVSLPTALAFSVACSLVSAGIAWGATSGRITALESHQERHEKRMERLEDAIARMLPAIERIDERTRNFHSPSK